MGKLILSHEGTSSVRRDSMMVFFNDPIAVQDPVERAVRMACAMRFAFQEMKHLWSGADTSSPWHGIAQGEATLGAIGSKGAGTTPAIGSVTNLAARLCSEALGGHSHRRESLRAVAPRGSKSSDWATGIKGFPHPIPVCNITGGDRQVMGMCP